MLSWLVELVRDGLFVWTFLDVGCCRGCHESRRQETKIQRREKRSRLLTTQTPFPSTTSTLGNWDTPTNKPANLTTHPPKRHYAPN